MTVPVVGALLIFSLMIGPPAAARSLTSRPGLAMLWSVVIALVTVWAAIAASYTYNWPVGFFVGTSPRCLTASAAAGPHGTAPGSLPAPFPGRWPPRVTVDAAIAAEKAGFDDVWFAEHHFMSYGICPSARTLAAFTLGRTSRITVGTAVSVLPVWHPVALAEQAALLDQVSQAASRRRFCSPRVPTLLSAGSKMIEGHGCKLTVTVPMGEAAPPEDRLKRHDLTDVEWARLGPLLPGHPRQGHRSATLFHDLRDTL